MSENDPDIDIDPIDYGVNARVFLKLYEQDLGGDDGGREGRSEYLDRSPACVSEFTQEGLTLEISNAGHVASDLVGIEYQLVFCTYAGHTAQEGFTVSHTQEEESSDLDKLTSADFVLPRQSIFKRILFPPCPDQLANIYFRARVSTIWARPVPRTDWNFASESSVTEAHLRIARLSVGRACRVSRS
jgi:hypothetical protein